MTSRAWMIAFWGMVGCGPAIGNVAGGSEEDGVREPTVVLSKKHFDYVFEQNDASAATGVLMVPTKGSKTVRSTCGVTFITGRYAITAAHCVDTGDLPRGDELLEVQQLRLDGEMPSLLETTTTLVQGGDFPSWRPSRLFSATAGYHVTRYTRCRVVASCDPDYNPIGRCESTADVALLKCEDRPATAASLPVATRVSPSRAVTMYWFHEVYAAPEDETRAEFDRHYTRWSEEKEQNFHYLGRDSKGRVLNQLMPLASVKWPGNLDRTVNGRAMDRGGLDAWTDLYGCHGSSGSGILQLNPETGGHELLGPVSHAALWGTLCLDPKNVKPGSTQLSYPLGSNTPIATPQDLHSRATHKLAAQAMADPDR